MTGVILFIFVWAAIMALADEWEHKRDQRERGNESE